MKHTPGPWTQFSEKGSVISIMPSGRSGDVCVFKEPYPSNADARLMSLAPQLYRVLEYILVAMEASGGWEGDDMCFAMGMAALRAADGKDVEV